MTITEMSWLGTILFPLGAGAIGFALGHLFDNHLSRRRIWEADLIDARRQFRKQVFLRLGVFRQSVAYWPSWIDAYLIRQLPFLSVAVDRYCEAGDPAGAAELEKAWRGFVKFCEEATPDQQYRAAYAYDRMATAQNPCEILRGHVDKLLEFNLQVPWRGPRSRARHR